MKRLVMPAVIGMLAASCGGGEDGAVDTTAGAESTGTTAPQGSSDETSEGTTTTTTAATDDAGGRDFSGIGAASVTIDGETYYFGETSFPAPQCEPDFFGVFVVTLMMVDEAGNEIPSGGGLQLQLLGEGTDPGVVGQLPEASVDIEALDQEWKANEEDFELFDLEPGTSQVDDYTIDGNTASGTATFYERNSYYAFVGGSADAVSVAEGTFEVTCADS